MARRSWLLALVVFKFKIGKKKEEGEENNIFFEIWEIQKEEESFSFHNQKASHLSSAISCVRPSTRPNKAA